MEKKKTHPIYGRMCTLLFRENFVYGHMSFECNCSAKTMNSEFGWRWFNIVEFYMWLVAIVELVLKLSMQERARRDEYEP